MRAMRVHGMSAREIARELVRTVPSVKCRLCAEGVRQGFVLNRYLPYVTIPHTLKGVARALAVSVWAVKQAKRRLRAEGYKLYNLKTRRLQKGVQRKYRPRRSA